MGRFRVPLRRAEAERCDLCSNPAERSIAGVTVCAHHWALTQAIHADDRRHARRIAARAKRLAHIGEPTREELTRCLP